MTVPIGLSPSLSSAAVENALRDPLHCAVEDHSAGALLSVLAQWDVQEQRTTAFTASSHEAAPSTAPLPVQEVMQAAAAPDPEAALSAAAVDAVLLDPSVDPLLRALRNRLLALQEAQQPDHWATCAEQASAWLQGEQATAPWLVSINEQLEPVDPLVGRAPSAMSRPPESSGLQTTPSSAPPAPAWVLDCAWAWSLGALPSVSHSPERWQELLDQAGPAGRAFFEQWVRVYALGRFTPSLLGIWGAVGTAFAKALPPTSFGRFDGPSVSLRLLPLWACLPTLSAQQAAQIKSANAWMAVCSVLCCDARSGGARAQDLLALAEELRQGRGGLRLAPRFGRLTQAFWPRRWMDRAWPGNLARLACLVSLIAGALEGHWLWGAGGLVAFFLVFMVLQSWRMARALWIGRPGWEKGWPHRAVDAAWSPLWRDESFVPPLDPHALYAQKTGTSGKV